MHWAFLPPIVVKFFAANSRQKCVKDVTPLDSDPPMHVIIEADQRYSIPGKDQFRYIKIHLRLRGMGLNKAKEIISRFILLFPRASEPCMNFNVF